MLVKVVFNWLPIVLTAPTIAMEMPSNDQAVFNNSRTLLVAEESPL